jgi:DNA-binding FadR family transcriptional regulator
MTDATAAETASRSFLGLGATRTPAARLGVAVVHDLVSAIVTGEVRPGESLPPEGVLSQQFGVSRTVIRESVKRVEEKGLVTVVQGRGTQVEPPSSWNVLDPVVLSAMVDNDDSLGVLDEVAIVRASLEASMAAATTERLTDDALARLRDALRLMHDTAADADSFDAADDADSFAAADADFHLLVMELSGNRLAESITKILFVRARESLRFRGARNREIVDLTLREHDAVVRAIEAGDPALAAETMRTHIAEAWKRRRFPTHRPAD